jgi:hypothetical protein
MHICKTCFGMSHPWPGMRLRFGYNILYINVLFIMLCRLKLNYLVFLHFCWNSNFSLLLAFKQKRFYWRRVYNIITICQFCFYVQLNNLSSMLLLFCLLKNKSLWIWLKWLGLQFKLRVNQGHMFRIFNYSHEAPLKYKKLNTFLKQNMSKQHLLLHA